MRWFIVALIYAGTLFAQPNGPYEIASVGIPMHITSPKVAVDNDGIAHVFFVETTYSTYTLFYARVNAQSGDLLSTPEPIYELDSLFIQLEDAALDEHLDPIILVTTSRGSAHWITVIRRSNNLWTETDIARTDNVFVWPCGMLYSGFQGSRIVLASSEMVQIVACETGNTCVGFSEPYAIPIVSFFENESTFSTYALSDFERFMWPQSQPACSYSADSMHLWVMDTWGRSTRLGINRDGEHTAIASYECVYGELAGMRIGEDEFIQASDATLCDPLCIFFVRISGNECTEIGNIRPNQIPNSAAIYESHGFVILTFDYEHVELVRVDTEANLAAPIGTIGWRDSTDHLNIETAATGVSSQGEIATVWSDHNSNTGIDRLWLASCEWLTPLDVTTPPVQTPDDYLLTTYPNPFNNTVRIDYDLPRASDVTLSIYNTIGQKVATLFNGHTEVGTHTVNWSPETTSGVYFVKLVSGEFVTSQKILYIR